VQSGPANQSYGIQVGKLAGLPARVIASAQEKLASLEHQELLHIDPPIAPALPSMPQQSELFQGDAKLLKLQGQILDIELDQLSPRDALSLLYELKDQLL
jgi:DNA mismatch repair protein MutS